MQHLIPHSPAHSPFHLFQYIGQLPIMYPNLATWPCREQVRAIAARDRPRFRLGGIRGGASRRNGRPAHRSSPSMRIHQGFDRGFIRGSIERQSKIEFRAKVLHPSHDPAWLSIPAKAPAARTVIVVRPRSSVSSFRRAFDWSLRRGPHQA